MAKSAKKKSAAKPPTALFSSPQSSSDLPKPWTEAPTSLDPFLSNLETDHFYIISLDRHDKAFKRRLFTVPLFLNIFLTILVIYRVYTAIPTYFDIAVQLLGHETPQKVDIRHLPRSTAFYLWLRRALMFLGDFILVRFVGMWPLDFFLGRGILSGDGEAGPVAWRRTVSFRDVEVVVRRSRTWDRSIFAQENATGTATVNVVEDILSEGIESPMFQVRILPGVARRYMQQKTGYQMLDKSWDLYFSAMIEAHALVDEGTSKLEDFRTSLIVHTHRWGWLAWEIWKEHLDSTGDESTSKLQNIKDTLTALGKENLFFRTIEVVQSETNVPGTFTSERRQKTIDKIREEFEEQKLDFDDFWSHVGGIESMPGLAIAP